jgi:hypothetical protein
MKKARFLITIVGFGVLRLGRLGLVDAEEPSRPPAEQILRQNHPTGALLQEAVKSRPLAEQVLHENHSTSDRSASPAHGKIDPKEEKPSHPKEDSHAPRKIGQEGRIKTEPKRITGDQLRKPDLKKSATAANGGSMMNKTGKPHEQLAKLRVDKETGLAHPDDVRSRVTTGTVLGGARMASSAKNSVGVLGGACTSIKRKY